ncbi:MAG: hypothetical protein Q8M76_19280 [Spirochaetaceae bacterium]|nr:hypothetical protein [Spirochaetaceae bacterium]
MRSIDVSGGDRLVLDPRSAARGLLIQSLEYPSDGTTEVCDFSDGPKIGSDGASIWRLTGSPRKCLGLWAIPGSGYLILAYDDILGATIAALIDDSLAYVAGSGFIVDYRELDPAVGIAVDGRILVLSRTSDTAYRAYVLSSSGVQSPRAIEIAIPSSLMGANAIWAGDRFWLRAGRNLAPIGFDRALGQVTRLLDAEALDPLSGAIGLEDGGIVLYGPADPIGLGRFGDFTQGSEIYLIRYDRDVADRRIVRIRFAAPPGEDHFAAQAFVLAAAEDRGQISLVVRSSSRESSGYSLVIGR